MLKLHSDPSYIDFSPVVKSWDDVEKELKTYPISPLQSLISNYSVIHPPKLEEPLRALDEWLKPYIFDKERKILLAHHGVVDNMHHVVRSRIKFVMTDIMCGDALKIGKIRDEERITKLKKANHELTLLEGDEDIDWDKECKIPCNIIEKEIIREIMERKEYIEWGQYVWDTCREFIYLANRIVKLELMMYGEEPEESDY